MIKNQEKIISADMAKYTTDSESTRIKNAYDSMPEGIIRHELSEPFRGSLTENYVAQTLVSGGRKYIYMQCLCMRCFAFKRIDERPDQSLDK